MSWAEQRARLLAPKPAPLERPRFEPGLPYFVSAGPNRWVLTPYARSHCVFFPEELAAGDTTACPEHRRKLDETVMPWDAPADRGPGRRCSGEGQL